MPPEDEGGQIQTPDIDFSNPKIEPFIPIYKGAENRPKEAPPQKPIAKKPFLRLVTNDK
jgi:hypothetical protein